jgi:hypothetical protein
MDFYDRIALMMGLPVILAAIFVVPYAYVYHTQRKMSPEALAVQTPATRQYTTAMLIVLYIAHPPIALDVLGSLRCEEVRETGHFMSDDMSVDCSQPAYKAYRIVAVMYTIVYIVGGVLFVCWRIWDNRGKLENTRLNYSHGDLPYVYFVRGYRRGAYLWEAVVLARKLGIVICGAFLSSGLQLVWGFIVITSSLLFTAIKKPYETKNTQLLTPNRLENCALVALACTVVLGFHSQEAQGGNVGIFVLVIAINSTVVLLLVASVVAKLKKMVSALSKIIAMRLNLNEDKRFDDVELRRRPSSGSFGPYSTNARSLNFDM